MLSQAPIKTRIKRALTLRYGTTAGPKADNDKALAEMHERNLLEKGKL